MTDTKQLYDTVWECIYDHGNGKHQGDASAAQRAKAVEALDRLLALAAPAAKCATCNGHGLVGGHMQDGSGYGEGCPDCNPDPAPAAEPEAMPADWFAGMPEQYRTEAWRIASTRLRGGVPGWKLVPVEPTPEMQTAALPYVMRQHQTRQVWRSMVEAAPATTACVHPSWSTDEDGFCTVCGGNDHEAIVVAAPQAPAPALDVAAASLAAIHCRLVHGGPIDSHTVSVIVAECERAVPGLAAMSAQGGA